MSVMIKDVAKAGVFPTVTCAIQNKSTISDETKKRVRKAYEGATITLTSTLVV